MLQIAEAVEPVDGQFSGAFDSIQGWSAMPIEPTIRQLRIFLGDPVSGPLVWLFNGAPLDPETRAAREPYLRNPGPLRHLHRTPTFRVACGEQPRQLLLNNSWYGSGDYFLLDANKVYTDPTGLEGFLQFLVFADRRGMHPVRNDHTAQMNVDELIAYNTDRFMPFGDGLSFMHTRDEDAIGGVAVSFDGAERGKPVTGSIDDHSRWSRLSDGSMVAGAFMGDASGPVVLMSENAPNAVETAAARCGTDMIRVIARGSCRIGERVYEAGSFVATETGAMIEEVVHGPQGSTQVALFSDRRFWKPVDGAGVPVASVRIGEIERMLAPWVGAPASAA